MSGDTTTEREYSETDLREAGASALFVAYYQEAGPTASARREVEKGPFSLEALAEKPSVGGHFFDRLWNGDEKGAWQRADSRNSAILEAVTGKSRKEALAQHM